MPEFLGVDFFKCPQCNRHYTKGIAALLNNYRCEDCDRLLEGKTL